MSHSTQSKPTAQPESIQSRILRADFEGASKEQFKALYVERNTLGLVGNERIYRVLELDHLLSDVRNGVLTLPRIHPRTFSCNEENPLLDAVIIDSDGTQVYLDTLMAPYYCASWSLHGDLPVDSFLPFGVPAVRIASSPARVLSSACSVDDPFYMLHTFIGKMEYPRKEELKRWREEVTVDSLVDSLGHRVARSFLRLSEEDYAHEGEVRLIFNYQHGNNPHIQQNVNLLQAAVDLCQIPYDWPTAGIEVVDFENCPEDDIAELYALLEMTVR